MKENLESALRMDRLAVKTFDSRECMHFFEKLTNTHVRRNVHPNHEVYDRSGRIMYGSHLSDSDLSEKISMHVFNPLTQGFEIKERNKVRGMPKAPDYPYTKKVSVSLLPRNGKCILYKEDVYKFGIFIDLAQCHLKDEKYFFLFDAWTINKWWVNHQPGQDLPIFETVIRPRYPNHTKIPLGPEYFQSYPYTRFISIINNFDEYLQLFDAHTRPYLTNEMHARWLTELRRRMIAHRAIWISELLVGVSKNSVMSLFYQDDSSFLEAKELQAEILRIYGIRLDLVKYYPVQGVFLSA